LAGIGADAGIVVDVDQRNGNAIAYNDVDAVDIAAFAAITTGPAAAPIATLPTITRGLLVIPIASVSTLPTGPALAA
jgi:hypothetical protein